MTHVNHTLIIDGELPQSSGLISDRCVFQTHFVRLPLLTQTLGFMKTNLTGECALLRY